MLGGEKRQLKKNKNFHIFEDSVNINWQQTLDTWRKSYSVNVADA